MPGCFHLLTPHSHLRYMLQQQRCLYIQASSPCRLSCSTQATPKLCRCVPAEAQPEVHAQSSQQDEAAADKRRRHSAAAPEPQSWEEGDTWLPLRHPGQFPLAGACLDWPWLVRQGTPGGHWQSGGVMLDCGALKVIIRRFFFFFFFGPIISFRRNALLDVRATTMRSVQCSLCNAWQLSLGLDSKSGGFLMLAQEQ